MSKKAKFKVGDKTNRGKIVRVRETTDFIYLVETQTGERYFYGDTYLKKIRSRK